MTSKSFGYALRGILYVAVIGKKQEHVRVEEIAKNLSVPRHFLGKILKKIVKAGILRSTKGPHGGFGINEETLSTPLIRLINITDGLDQFNTCVLKLRKCNKANPCPLHFQIEKNRNELLEIFSHTTIADLLKMDKKTLLHSIAV